MEAITKETVITLKMETADGALFLTMTTCINTEDVSVRVESNLDADEALRKLEHLGNFVPTMLADAKMLIKPSATHTLQ